jgi:hypothetical protein
MTQHKKSGGTAKQRAFLATFAATGNITAAAAIAKVARKSHYRWLDDEAYAAEFADAQEQACDSLEAEARRRATEGVDEPVFYKGKECGTVRRYSDTLLIFLLKGAIPEKYKDRVENRIKREGILGGLSDEELETIARGGSN